MEGDLQYWLNGEPVLPDTGHEELKYWLNGEPYVVVEPGGTPPTPPASVNHPTLLTLGVG